MSDETGENLPMCTQCFGHMADSEATLCAHCAPNSRTAVTRLATLRARGRGSLVLAALGVSLTLGACESSTPQDAKENPTSLPTSTTTPVSSEPTQAMADEDESGAAKQADAPSPPQPEPAPVLVREAIDVDAIDVDAPSLKKTGGPAAISVDELKALREQSELNNAIREQKGKRRERPRKRPVPMYGMPPR